ncbi:phage tail tape measure protein [Streptomyces sp. NPDC048392]|uniref:phage tail tape measure protein n=1 Tax=Streptomyces sp. NPDC048392 TaxID=3365543 RepID=UPI003721E395
MATLDELLVEIGIDADDLTAGTDGAADDVERALAGVGDAADAMGRDIADAADQAATAMDDVGASADEAAQGAEQAASDVEGSFKNIAAGAAGAAVGTLFAAGLESAMNARAANTKLTNQLGLTAEESARAGKVAGDVFKAGFSDSLDGVNEALAGVTANIGGMGKATDAELTQMTKSALALADTFGFDVNEATQAVGTLLKAGLARDGEEAFDLLTAAAKKLPPAMQEELPTLTREYGEFFNQLGFSGPEMMGILAQAAKNPTFEIDKMGDALKEFTLLMADTSAVSEPLKELGLNVEDIQRLMNEGKGTEAFDKVIEALRGVEDQTKRTTLQAALFGGPGEDMGNSLLNLKATGADAAAGLDQVAGASKGLTTSVEEAKTFDSVWRNISTTLGEALAPALSKVSDFMTEHPELVKVLVPLVFLLAAAFALVAVSVWAANAAFWANPITWIVLLIVGLLAILALVILRWDEVKAATLDAWDATTGKIGDGVDWVQRKIEDWLGLFRGAWGYAWDWVEGKAEDAIGAVLGTIGWLGSIPGEIQGIFGDVLGYLAGLPGRIGRTASGMWESIVREFKNAVNQLIWMWNGLSFTLGGGSFMGVDIPTVTLSTPDIPYLAEGGITTGPTLAMIGEGPEDEAVLPLSKLDALLNTTAPAVARVESADRRLILELRGGSRAFREFLQESVSAATGGDIDKYVKG